ncbi:hypothetical protein ACOQFL_10335 [Actinopolyspora sp. H202]|uniref:hypothetical protein n=1 Tax=Actinopolyspora sp. H202 TaxID=1500456 RepID=UPI003EE7FA58
MDPEEIYVGVYVVWDPFEGEAAPGTARELLAAGHPGIITEPYWQDVGVKWLLREKEIVTRGFVYNYKELKKVTPSKFLEACQQAKERKEQGLF